MAPALLTPAPGLSASHGCSSSITREQVEGKYSACVLRGASHKYNNIQEEETREEGRRMLRARMSASENVCPPGPSVSKNPARSLGCPECMCVHVCMCMPVSCWGGRGACCRGSVHLWVTTAQRPSPDLSGPPQPASPFSGSQMSPRCFSLPAWLRAVRVCVYFGQPTK